VGHSVRLLAGYGPHPDRMDGASRMKEKKNRFKLPTYAQIRVLKCRETGETGLADMLNYNRKTGRYELVTAFGSDDDDDGGSEF